MKDYLADAKCWVNESSGIPKEQLESVIESLGYRIKDSTDMSEEQQSSIREAMQYLNGLLRDLAGEAPVLDSEVVAPQASVTAPELDSSSLFPVGESQAPQLSNDEKKKVLDGLIGGGMIQRGTGAISRR